MKEYVAHSGTPEHPEGQALIDHLRSVKILAESFFTDVFLREVAGLIGLYHDAGKAKQEVQEHIKGGTKEKIDHSTMGGYLLHRKNQLFTPFLAPPILGHHGGLPDGAGKSSTGRSTEARLQDAPPEEAVAAFHRLTVQTAEKISLPRPPIASAKTAAFEVYMMIKMLHSALVDADYLDTELFYDPDKGAKREKKHALADFLEPYDRYMEELAQESQRKIEQAHIEEQTRENQKRVNQIRAEIRKQCLQAASEAQGIFSLSVPTGGGKTLSSLGFALYHAKRHPNIKRILYAIPFTSIIEQNADVFRKALGSDAVVEFHSAVKLPEKGEAADFSCENFDAPLMVTSNVQIFDSIFANRPSKCRKLHNLQDSIIILDEMQALPDAVLRPCLAALDALAKDFHTTVVICTATQPKYDSVWPEAPRIREIIKEPGLLYRQMKRTKAVMLGKLSDEQLVERLSTHEQVLCIVNSRAQAQRLAKVLGGQKSGVYHLSTKMCPEHRRNKLKRIGELLENGKPCRLISTSVIEAGVDVDFPVVYRAAAGLDSIVQAAGRGNRNGKWIDAVPVYIFESEEQAIPPEIRRLANQTMTEIAPAYADILEPEAIEAYFRLRFGSGAQLDKHGILPLIESHRADLLFPFAEIGELFSTIESAGEALFVPYDENSRRLIRELENAPTRGLLRKLQRYSVTVYANQWKELEERHYVREVNGVRILDVAEEQFKEVYSEEYGLIVSAPLNVLFA